MCSERDTSHFRFKNATSITMDTYRLESDVLQYGVYPRSLRGGEGGEQPLRLREKDHRLPLRAVDHLLPLRKNHQLLPPGLKDHLLPWRMMNHLLPPGLRDHLLPRKMRDHLLPVRVRATCCR